MVTHWLVPGAEGCGPRPWVLFLVGCKGGKTPTSAWLGFFIYKMRVVPACPPTEPRPWVMVVDYTLTCCAPSLMSKPSRERREVTRVSPV